MSRVTAADLAEDDRQREYRNRDTGRAVYMVHVDQSSGFVFVKEYNFFAKQGGFKEDWGKDWVPFVAVSIEDAREKGCALPGARSYIGQAK